MADAYRGLTLKLGADARPAKSAIDSITKSAGRAQGQLRKMEKALKLDPANTRALASGIDLVRDKAAHSARAVVEVGQAISQAGGKAVAFGKGASRAVTTIEKMAAATTDVYAETQRLRAGYNHVDAELAHIYEAAAKVKAAQDKVSFDKALRSVRDMAKAMGGVGDEADKARAEVEKLVRLATMDKSTGLAERFGMGGMNNVAAGWKMARGVLANLRREHARFQEDLESMNEVEGYRALKVDLVAFEAELREAAARAASLKSQLFAAGGAEGLSGAVSQAKRLDSALDQAREASRRMSAALDLVPASLATAKAKMAALRSEQGMLVAKMESLESVMGKIAASRGFDKQAALAGNVYLNAARAEQAVENLEAELREAEERAKLLQGQIDEKKANPYDKTIRSLDALGAELKDAESKADKLRSKLAKADDALKKAALAKGFREASEEVAALNARLEETRALASASKSWASFGASLKNIGYATYSTVTPALMMAGRYAVRTAEDIDSAYRDMRKTVNGTEEQFESLKAAAIDFSRAHVTTAEQILEIESIGGQLGIAAGDLEAFGRTVSNLDIATNMDAEDIALDLAKLANIMHFGQERYDSFADALVRLGNNEPALESDIMKISTRFAGMAANVGMATSDVLGLATAATATGQKAEAAGGSIQRTLSRIGQAVSAGGDELESYAAISNMTADEFASTWRDAANHGPIRAIQAFVEGLRRVKERGGDVDSALGALKINGVRDKQLLSGLTNTTDVLAESLEMAADAWDGMSTTMSDGTVEKAGDAMREAERKSEGFSGSLGKLRNQAAAVANEMAEGAAPIVDGLASAFGGLSEAVSSMPAGVKTATVGMAGLLAAMGPVAVATGSVMDGVVTMREAMQKVSGMRMWNSLASDAERLSVASKSAILNATGLTRKMMDNAASIEKARAAQSRHVEALGSESAALAAHQAKLERAQKGYSKLAGGVRAVGNVLKGVGAALAVGAVVVGVEQVGEALADEAAKADAFAKANEGTGGLVERMGKMAESASGRVAGLSASMSGSSAKDYRQDMLDAAQAVVEFNNAMGERLDSAEEGAALAEYWGKRVAELSAGFDGSEESLAELQGAVDQYNDATGASLKVVDDLTGRLSMSTEAMDANTEAFKQNAYAQAYADVAKDALKEAISIDVEKAKATAELTGLYAEQADAIGKLAEASGSYEEAVSWYESDDESFGELRTKITNLSAYVGQLSGERAEQEKLAEAAFDQARAQKEAADAAGKAAAELSSGAAAAVRYRDALERAGAAGTDLDAMWESLNGGLGAFEGGVDELAGSMDACGVTAGQLAATGTEAFIDLYVGAKQNMDAVARLLSYVDDFQIDPKKFYVTDDGTIKAKRDELDEADLKRIRDKGFKVSDDGTIEKVRSELDALDKMTAKPRVSCIDGATPVIDQVERRIREMAARSATIGLNATGPVLLNAAGGVARRAVARAPRRASGAINGIVARPTLTNIGWTGEAGAEAILHMRNAGGAVIPLSNRHYVRPFARAVASEMGGARGRAAVVSNKVYVTVDWKAGQDAASVAEELAGALRRQNLMGE